MMACPICEAEYEELHDEDCAIGKVLVIIFGKNQGVPK